MTKATAAKHHPENNEEIEREPTTAQERLQGAAVTCHQLSQASLAPGRLSLQQNSASL